MADYERFIRYQAQSQDTGQAQVFSTLADRLRDFSNQVYETTVAPRIKERATIAGMEAGTAGTPELKSGFTLYGRAYNDAAVRAYALSQYSNLEQTLSQFETEAGLDVGKFNAKVDGWRTGAIQSALPESRMFISQMVQERLLEGQARITTAARKQAMETQRTEIAGGLDALAGRVSKLYLSGNPADVAKASEYGQTYLAMIDASVADGTFTPKEGAALKNNHLKNSMEWIAAGELETQYRIPGGNPVAVIQGILSNPSLTDDDRQALGRNLYARLDLLQRGDAELARQQDADAKAMARQAEADLTIEMFQGTLTGAKITAAIRTRGLDPAVGRTLFDKLNAGPGKDDDRERFIVESNILSYSAQEIADNPRLSWDTKRVLVEKRRTLEGGWPDSNNSQEARQRIDRAVGIVPGVPNPFLSQQTAIDRGQAQTRWFELMQALPPDQREAQAIPMAQQVINEVISKRSDAERARVLQQLDRARKDLAAAKSDREKNVIQGRIDALNKKLGGQQ